MGQPSPAPQRLYLPESGTTLAFTPPLARTDYLVRHPAEAWVAGLGEAFENACADTDFETMSSVLNNLAFVLFKGGVVEQAAELCQSHYGGFVAARSLGIAMLAVQPWINEGRLLARKGAFEEARKRLLPGLSRDEAALIVAGRALYPLDPDIVQVCRNVALVDGFFLELSAGGLDAAEAHLAKFTDLPPENSLLEFRLQVALARNRPEEADALLEALCQTSGHPFTPATYVAAVAAARGDDIAFAKAVLLVVALLTEWADSVDETASILHALLWLRRIDRNRFCAIGGDPEDCLLTPQAPGGEEKNPPLFR